MPEIMRKYASLIHLMTYLLVLSKDTQKRSHDVERFGSTKRQKINGR